MKNARRPHAKVQQFRYIATTPRGNKRTGVIAAASLPLAKAMLKKQRLTVVKITPASTLFAHTTRRIPKKQQLIALRTLATLTSAGITLTQALAIVAESSSHSYLAQVLFDIKADIESGSSFANAIHERQAIFGALTAALIDAGEKSGTLDEMLTRIADHSEQQAALKAKLNQALRYPAAIVITAIVVLAVMLIKIVPAFAETFISMGNELPLPTRIVLDISQMLSRYFWWILLGSTALVAGFVMAYKKRPDFRRQLAARLLSLPIIGKLIAAVATARFAQTFTITFEAGLPLIEAIYLAGKATNHPSFIDATRHIATKVQSGQKLAEAMNDTKLFSAMSVQLVSIGETSGRLSQMLSKIADYHTQAVNEATDTLLGLLEPLIIVVMGVAVGALVLAMYLPIFNMSLGGA